MLLSESKAGQRYTVSGSGYTGRLRARLDCLGLVEGEEIFVLANSFAGLIVIIKGSRLAVCKSLAKKVQVA